LPWLMANVAVVVPAGKVLVLPSWTPFASNLRSEVVPDVVDGHGEPQFGASQ
jgi:hypothetical protein